MAETDGLSVFALSSVDEDMGSCEAVRSACERSVRVTPRDQHERLLGCLWLGPLPQRSLPELELRRGDRLEPCIDFPDWRIVDDADVAQYTLELRFWRSSVETMARHRVFTVLAQDVCWVRHFCASRRCEDTTQERPSQDPPLSTF